MSAELAVQRAIYKALCAVSEIKVLIDCRGRVRVYDRVPQGTPRPYLHLREFQGLDDGADCHDGIEIFVGLDVWSDEAGKPEASRLAGHIRRALHYAPLALTAPWSLVEMMHRETTISDDGLLVRARMSFRALVERVDSEEP